MQKRTVKHKQINSQTNIHKITLRFNLGPKCVEPSKWPNPGRKAPLQIKEDVEWRVTGSKLVASKEFSLQNFPLVIFMSNVNS